MDIEKIKKGELSNLVEEFQRLINSSHSDLDYYYKDKTFFWTQKEIIRENRTTIKEIDEEIESTLDLYKKFLDYCEIIFWLISQYVINT